jgi:hypothetical protein
VRIREAGTVGTAGPTNYLVHPIRRGVKEKVANYSAKCILKNERILKIG